MYVIPSFMIRDGVCHPSRSMYTYCHSFAWFDIIHTLLDGCSSFNAIRIAFICEFKAQYDVKCHQTAQLELPHTMHSRYGMNRNAQNCFTACVLWLCVRFFHAKDICNSSKLMYLKWSGSAYRTTDPSSMHTLTHSPYASR